MNISFSLDDTAVTKKLRQMSGDARDLSEPFGRAGDDLLVHFGETVFETEGGANGDPWRALAESTLKARENRAGHYANPPERTDKILWWTGALKRGFKKGVKKDELRISNDVEYFPYHQSRGGSPPQRKMLAITSKVIETVVERVVDYMDKSVKR